VPHDDVQAGREHVCRHLSTRSPGNNATAAGIRNRAQWHFRPAPGGRPPGLQPASPRVRTSPAGQGAAVHCGAGQGSFSSSDIRSTSAATWLCAYLSIHRS
jgi:hypothetical protein